MLLWRTSLLIGKVSGGSKLERDQADNCGVVGYSPSHEMHADQGNAASAQIVYCVVCNRQGSFQMYF